MSRSLLSFLFISFCLFGQLIAEDTLDCRVVTANATECNPFGAKFIRAKEVSYDEDTKKLIVSKTLPFAKRERVKVISVADMLERYGIIEDSLRFRGTEEDLEKVSTKGKVTVTQKKKIKTKKRVKTKKVKTKKVKFIKVKRPKVASLPRKNKEKIKKTEPASPGQQNIKKVIKKVQTSPSIVEVKPKKIYGMYTVVGGDVVGRIANKFEMTTKELLSLNNLDKKSTLHIGQKFKIPLTQKMVDAISSAKYTIESGDTLLSIAYKFNVEPKDLVRFNNIKSNTLIGKGKKLSLPLPYVIKKLERKKKAEAKKKKEEKRRLANLKKKKKKLRMIRGIGKRKLRVTATAYSSHKNQTDSTPFLAAWNNRLRPGMKIIAVSRDMLTRYGMRNGTRVRIGGLQGYYTVRDKMNKRYKKRIDIYMGLNRRRALRWGRRSVVIYW